MVGGHSRWQDRLVPFQLRQGARDGGRQRICRRSLRRHRRSCQRGRNRCEQARVSASVGARRIGEGEGVRLGDEGHARQEVPRAAEVEAGHVSEPTRQRSSLYHAQFSLGGLKH